MSYFSNPFVPAFNLLGLVAPAAKCFFYLTGTSTPATVYADADLTTPLANPVVANINGRLPDIFLDDSIIYRVRLETALGALIDEVDPFSAIIGFIQAGTGAISRTTQDKQREVVSIGDFGAVGDDSTNNNTAIANAIAAVQAKGGGNVHIPAGLFRYTAINVPAGNSVNIIGEGVKSVLIQTVATGVGITLTPNDCSVRSVRLTASVARTNYDPFVLLVGGNCFVTDCSIDADRCGIKMTGVTCDVFHNTFANGVSGARRIWSSGGDKSQAVFNNIMHAQAPGVEAGVYTDDSSALKVYDNDIVGQGSCLKIAPGTGQVVVSLKSHDNFYDTALTGILVAPTGEGRVMRIKSRDDWTSSHTGSGVLLDTSASTGLGGIDGVDIIGTEANLNAVNGITLEGVNTTNVRVTRGSSRGNTSAGFTAGVGVTKFYVTGLGCNISDDLPDQPYGVFLSGSNGDYEITDCDLRDQTTEAIHAHSGWTSTKQVSGNRGYVTGNGGASAILAGNTSVTVNHGLSETPRAQDINIQQSVAPTLGGNVISLDTTSITATQFTVRVGEAPGGDVNFTWKISAGDN